MPVFSLNPVLFLLLNLSIPLLGGFISISFGEHQLHRHLMHRKRLPKFVYRVAPYLLGIFEAHAVRHHAQWYREFDFEPDEYGRLENLHIGWTETFWILLGFSPIIALVMWLLPVAGTLSLLMVVFHNRLWNVIHDQMHLPREVFFKEWPVFKLLARNHFLHHVEPRSFYNVVFPFADYIMGTSIKPRQRDVKEMMRLGYLTPRTVRGARVLEKLHQKTRAVRADFMKTFVSSMTREEAVAAMAAGGRVIAPRSASPA
jgi:hypothetical protein